ncbi:MAG: hypothetical protein ACKVOH_05565 [Chlamydiales bacterium]
MASSARLPPRLPQWLRPLSALPNRIERWKTQSRPGPSGGDSSNNFDAVAIIARLSQVLKGFDGQKKPVKPSLRSDANV